MRAAVLSSPGDLSVCDAERPECPTGGALIKVEACAVCPSDIKMARDGHRDLSYPRILGHEVVGRIEEADTPFHLQKGDRVQIWPGLTCGTCPSCLSGQDNMCFEQGIFGFNRDGGFAQYMAVPPESTRSGLNLVRGGASSRALSLTEPLACCVHAQDLCSAGTDDDVLVMGAGPMGLLHIMLAALRGARAVAVEPIEERRALAEQLGAVAIDPARDGVAEQVLSATEGRGADIAMMATPAADPAEVLRAMAPRGRVCMFSGLPRTAPMRPIDMNQLHYRELTLIGAYGCTSRSDRVALDLIASGKVAVERLITMEAALEQLEEGFRHIERREGLKCVVTRF